MLTEIFEMQSLNEEDTLRMGKCLAAPLFSGAFVALFGDLGAGKTTLTRAIAAGLGIPDGILSPTFTIVREHESGKLPLYHFDAYRLSSSNELYDTGFQDYIVKGGVIVMEWCENVCDALPKDRLEVHLSGSGNAVRSLRFAAYGTQHAALLSQFITKMGEMQHE